MRLHRGVGGPIRYPSVSDRHVSGSAHPRIWYSSLADLTPRIDPYSVVIGPACRSEFQSKLARPLGAGHLGCRGKAQANPESIPRPDAAHRGPRATKQRPFVRKRNGHRSCIDRPVEVGEQPMIATPDGRARPRRVAATHLSRASPSGTRSRSGGAPLARPTQWRAA